MSEPKLVTFDCAGTLVEVRQPLISAIYAAAEHLEIPLTRDGAQLFQALYVARLPQFHKINLLRDPSAGVAFWRELAADWLERIGQSRSLSEPLQQEVDRATFGSESTMFALFEDTLPCLETLKEQGIPMAVISNWDYSLHRVLEMLGIHGYFCHVMASLEHGWEKPDPRLFEHTLALCGAAPEESLHVGDHPIDDIEGATGVGMRAILIDRDGGDPNSIRSLTQIQEHPHWIG